MRDGKITNQVMSRGNLGLFKMPAHEEETFTIMTIHKRIAEAREKKGLSQGELARRLGLTRSAISQWEAEGGTRPVGENLLKCAFELDVTPEWLQFGENTQFSWYFSNQNDIFTLLPLLEITEISKWIEKPVLTADHKSMKIPLKIKTEKGKLGYGSFVMQLTDSTVVDYIYRNPMLSVPLYGIFEINTEPKNNEIVLAETEQGKMFRVCKKDGEVTFFKSCDPDNTTILNQAEVKVIGVIKTYLQGHIDIRN